MVFESFFSDSIFKPPKHRWTEGCNGEMVHWRIGGTERFCLKKNKHCAIKRAMVLKSIILGIIQGLTEFLPVSSSGHLVIVKNLIGFKSPGVFFEILLHFATLLAIIIVFAKRIGKIIKSLFSARIRMKNGHWIVTDKNLRFFFYLLWASIPSALVGIFLKSNIEKLFSQPLFVSIMLLITGCVLFSLRFVRSEKLHEHNALSSTMIGITQAFSILPGISRSGVTISAGLWSGLSREEAAEFSFILVIPAILGALFLEKEQFTQIVPKDFFIYLIGAMAAFIIGLISLIILLKVIKKGRLYFFSYYCWLIGFATLFLYFFTR